MPDNLTVTIGADSSKLLADLKLAQAALKSLNAEMTALTKTAQQTGDRAAVDAMAPKIIAAQKEVVRLSTAWKGVAPSVNTATRSVAVFGEVSNRELIKFSRSFGSLNKSAETFGVIIGGAFGGFTGGLFARAISSVFGTFITQLDEASKRLTALQQQAREAGVKPIAVQAAGEAAEQAGLQAEAGEKAFTSFAKALAEARAAVPREATRGMQVLRGLGPDPNVTGAAVNDAAKGISAMDAAAKEATGSVRVLRGSVADATTQFDSMGRLLPTVLKGGTRDLKDFSNEWATLGIDPGRVKPEDTLKSYEIAIRRVLELAKQFPSQANVISQKLFGGLTIPDLQEITRDADKLDALIKKLAATQRGATDEHLKDNKELVKAQNEVTKAWNETTAAIANDSREIEIWYLKLKTRVIEGLPQALRDMFDFRVIKEGARLLGSTATTFSNAWTASINWVERQLSGLIGAFNATAAAASSMASAAGAAASTAGAAAMGIGGGASAGTPGTSSYQAGPAQMVFPTGEGSSFGVNVLRGGTGAPSSPLNITSQATGGYIRGPGSSTSDSILARLSNGEFVLNAGSVRRVGIGFLEALNSFAAGGLVSPLPRFAEGGLVGSGGTPVHLHLGGHSFALSGSESVVGSLVLEAHRHKIRSAGVKPSWYGGTPGR